MPKLSDLRFAHEEGKCILSYSLDGKVILTAGADGDVRLYKSIDDDDNVSHVVGDEVKAVACAYNKFYVAPSGTNAVQCYSLEEGQSEGVVANFGADASDLDLSADGKLLAAGSEDMTIKVIDTDSLKATIMKGHEAPICSVAIDSAEAKEFLASSSCDGTLCIWSLQSCKRIHIIKDVLPKSNDTCNSRTPAKMAWHPAGRFLCFPMKDHLQVIVRDTWNDRMELKPETEVKDAEYFSCVTWSPNGQYVVGATTSGNISLWRSKDGKVMAELKTGRGYGISSLLWHPSGRQEIAFIDDHGYWGVIEDISFGNSVPSTGNGTVETSKAGNEDDANQDLMTADELSEALFEDDDDNEDSFSIRQIKRETGFLSDDEASNVSKPEVKRPTEAAEEEIVMLPDDAKEQDEASAQPSYPPQPPLEQDIQEPFQPASTPIRLSSRFMVWNSVGIVRCYNSEDDNSIEVEFHDTSVHHPLHLSNVSNHIMADLSLEALVMACEASEEDSSASKLACVHFSSADHAKEWSVDMMDSEEIMAITCGLGWVAAATDRRRLRLFTVSGMQRDVISLPGPVVALAGHRSQLLVTVHLGMPLMGNQNIHFAVFDVNKVWRHERGQISYQPVALAPNSVLSWLGFSDEGTPCLEDSSGQVRLWNCDVGSWVEVCDTKGLTKGKSDHHFVLGVNEQERRIRSILCKGSRFPPTVPRPTVVEIPFVMPLCENITEKGMLEEQLLRYGMQRRTVRLLESSGRAEEVAESAEDLEKAQSEVMMKLFALACKANQESRALDVCRLMDTTTIQVAIKYATKLRKVHLANRLASVACNIQAEEEANRAETEEQVSDYGATQLSNNYSEEDDEESNPILAAKLKKEERGGGITRPLLTRAVDSQGESRNPFKTAAKKQGGGTIRQGLVFDDMVCSSQPSQTSSSKQFGSRVFSKFTPKDNQQNSTQRRPSNAGKENTCNECPSVKGESDVGQGTPLKGFQLWLEENRDDLSQELSSSEESELFTFGLQRWKQMARDDKERYRSPRLPQASKRKLDHLEKEDSPSVKSSRVHSSAS